jgi:transcriptional regulator with PAS, ATPase and Fis domain
LIDYNWPGNIRELENAIEHAYIRSKTNRIDYDALPHSITGSDLKEIENTIAGRVKGEETEKLQIKALLKKYNGNKTRIAKDLGLSRTTLWRRFKKHNLPETV